MVPPPAWARHGRAAKTSTTLIPRSFRQPKWAGRPVGGWMQRRSGGICVLVSGGLDSAVLLHRLLASGRRVLPVYVRCGLRWEKAELYWLRRLCRAMRSPRLAPLCVVDAPLAALYGSHWSLRGVRVPSARSADRAVYLPGRNLVLLSYAALVCARRHLTTIALGVLSSNPFGDASPRFFARFAACLAQALHQPMRVLTPLRHLTKARLIRSAARQVPLELTFSCLQPRGQWHCGRCNKCAERQRAFRKAGLADPTCYCSSRGHFSFSHGQYRGKRETSPLVQP